MEGLDNKWILGGAGTCAQDRTQDHQYQNTLGMETMADVFMLVAGGMTAGCILIVLEVMYKRGKNRRARRIVFAKRAAAKWREKVQVACSLD